MFARHRAVTLSLLAALSMSALACAKKNYDIGRCYAPAGVSPVSAAVSASDVVLRVATVNMWGIPLVSRDKPERFAALADRLNEDPSLDVVSLQEMWSGPDRRKLLRRVKESFPFYADFHSEFGGGLVVLSRHPFVEPPRFHHFSRRGKWWKPWTGEWFGHKGVGLVHLRVRGRTFWFADVHTHACYEDATRCNDGDEYARTRWRQMRELRQWVSRVAGDEPAIIAGDFNAGTHSPYAAFLASGEPTGDVAASRTVPWFRVPEIDEPVRRVDHVWLRPGRKESWYPAVEVTPIFGAPVKLEDGSLVPLSDHCALAATLRLAPYEPRRVLRAARAAAGEKTETAPFPLAPVPISN